MTHPLSAWNQLANANANAINPFIVRIRQMRDQLDALHPQWLKAFVDSAGDPLKQDCRRQYFTGVISAFQNAQLSYMFVLHQLSSQTWWHNFAPGAKKGDYEELAGDYCNSIKIFTFHSFALLTEDLIREFVRCGKGTFTATPPSQFQALYRHVWAIASLQRLDPLFEILRLTRNTIHNNGFFCPRDGKDVTLSYGGKTFEFKNRQKVEFVDEIFVLDWLPTNLCQAMFDLVNSPEVSAILTCTKGQP